VGLVVLGIVGVAVVTDAHPRLAASNSQVLVSGVVLTVAPGEDHCQAGQYIPEEVASLRVFVGTVDQVPGEALLFSIADASGAEIGRARVDDGYPLGALAVPIPSPEHDLADGEVCIRNLGSRPVAFAGHRSPANADALQQQGDDGPLDAIDEDIRIDFLRPHQESLWALAPEVAQRFSLFKPSFTGPWIMWVVLALAVVAGSSAVLLVVRQSPPVDHRRPTDEPK
jgi:hypothetical protein